MSIDRRFLLWGLGYAVIGMLLGIVMAASGNHGQHVAHAHVLLVGFVMSLLYGMIHRLWLVSPRQLLVRIQFSLHQTGAVVMFTGLYLLYGHHADPDMLHPVLGLASLAVLSGMLMMIYLVIKAR